jgi:Helicase associated domain
VDEETGVEHVMPNERLTAERLEKLESVGFAWSASRPKKPKEPNHHLLAASPSELVDLGGNEGEGSEEDDSGSLVGPIEWDAMLDRLVAFKSAHGHCNVSKGYAEDRPLAKWVECVRSIVGRQDSAIVSQRDDDEDMEDQLGPANHPSGNVNARRASGDDTGTLAEMGVDAASALEEVEEVQKKNSKEKRDSSKPGNDALCITDDRKEKLIALGFVWNLRGKRFEDHWDAMFRQVRRFLACKCVWSIALCSHCSDSTNGAACRVQRCKRGLSSAESLRAKSETCQVGGDSGTHRRFVSAVFDPRSLKQRAFVFCGGRGTRIQNSSSSRLTMLVSAGRMLQSKLEDLEGLA